MDKYVIYRFVLCSLFSRTISPTLAAYPIYRCGCRYGVFAACALSEEWLIFSAHCVVVDDKPETAIKAPYCYPLCTRRKQNVCAWFWYSASTYSHVVHTQTAQTNSFCEYWPDTFCVRPVSPDEDSMDITSWSTRSTQLIIHKKYNDKKRLNDIALAKVQDLTNEAQMLTSTWSKKIHTKTCFDVDITNKLSGQLMIQTVSEYEVQAMHHSYACPCMRSAVKHLICSIGKRACQYCTSGCGGFLFCEGDQLYGLENQIVDCRKCSDVARVLDCDQGYVYRAYTFVCHYYLWIAQNTNISTYNTTVKCDELPKCKNCGDFTNSAVILFKGFLLFNAFVLVVIATLL